MKIKRNLFFAFAILSMTTIFAQQPTVVPKPSERKVDFTEPASIVLLIILPICAVILYFIWRSKVKQDQLKKDSEENTD